MKRIQVLRVLLPWWLFLLLIASPDTVSSSSPPVDPRVWDDTADGKVGQFLVVFKSQANVRVLAVRAPNHEAQGRVVVNALQETAVTAQSGARAQLDALGVQYRAYWIVNALAVKADRAVVEAMLARGDVAAIESNAPFLVALEPARGAPQSVAAIEWNIGKVNAPAVWTKGYTGQGITYANADTGVQWDHPALKPHYRGWNGTTADHNFNWWDAIHTPVVGGSSCGYDLQVPCDDYPHGTHTLGTGVGDDGAGNQIGVAPGAQWIACRNMDNGWGQPSTYIECLQFLLAPTDLAGNNPDPNKRPDVIANSYDCNPTEGCAPHAMQVAVENLRAAGVFMAASAGNSGPNCSTVSTPPALEAAASTVGATGYMTDTIAAFSSRGPVTIDGSNRRKPDLVAPGVNIRSSLPTNGYGLGGGTSSASPHVAGAVALLWSAFPPLRRNIDLTENILAQSAVHLTSAQGCGGDTPTQVPNNVYGYGRLDVLAAFNYAMSISPPSYKTFFPLVKRDK
jgi:subtilisin family serine protease